LIFYCVVDAKERRKVINCDVPVAFMQVISVLAEMLIKVDPDLYGPYLVTENGKNVIYVQLDKALYVTLTAALLFWKDLVGELLSAGVVVNPYDSCVMNKIIKGSQCTVLWHVDDLKISHVDALVCEDIVDLLIKPYGVETPLAVTRGDLHDYLGMTLDYMTEGKVSVRMKDYVDNMLEELPGYFDGSVNTRVAEHLFKVDAAADTLDQDEADIYHSLTAKILLLCKRARLDV
jgi:hypothetical protein